eukprot:COSAG02_NODE_369_length_23680_cov_36.650609_7_plen_161_part_00
MSVRLIHVINACIACLQQECGARRAISPAFISSPALLHQHRAQPRAAARFLQNAESAICMGGTRCIGRLIKVCSAPARRAAARAGSVVVRARLALIREGQARGWASRGGTSWLNTPAPGVAPELANLYVRYGSGVRLYVNQWHRRAARRVICCVHPSRTC